MIVLRKNTASRLTDCSENFLPTLTQEQYEEGRREQQIFKHCFESQVIAPVDKGCSNTITVLPWSKGQPDYRDEHRQPQLFNVKGFFFYNWSPYAEALELIVPGESKSS